MAKDYYNILGVPRTASAEDIKRAYRKLAHQYHPDKSGGDEAKFKEINEAYQVLSDTEKRSKYDQFGSAFEQGGVGGASGMHWEDVMRQAGFGQQQGAGVEFDLGDIFSEFFGGGRGRGHGGRTTRRDHRGQDIPLDLALSLREAAFGVTKTVRLYRSKKCERCHGNGAEPGTPIKDCATCHGSGVIEHTQRSLFGAIRTQTSCRACDGEGKIAEKKCGECRGSGMKKSNVELEVSVPSGIEDGQTIRIAGQGEAGTRGAPAGDLYITVHVEPEEGLARDGNDVVTTLGIPYAAAVLGGKVSVTTLDGEVQLKIPAGTESGTALRLRGKGIPVLQGSGRGDHIFVIHISVPQSPGFREKRLLKELQKLEE